MMQRSAPPIFPEALDDDDDDVTWALETAAVQWKRGTHADALEWLRRAAESAVDGGKAIRARELTQATNALEGALRSGWVPGTPMPTGRDRTPFGSSAPPSSGSGRAGGFSTSRPPTDRISGGYSLRASSVPPAPESTRPFPLRTPRPLANPFLTPGGAAPLPPFPGVQKPYPSPPPAPRDADGTEPLEELEAYGELAVDIDLRAELVPPVQPRRSARPIEIIEDIEPVEDDDDDIEEFDDAEVIALSMPVSQRAGSPRSAMVSAPEVEAEEIEADDDVDYGELSDADVELEPDEIEPDEIEPDEDPDDDRPTVPPTSSRLPLPPRPQSSVPRASTRAALRSAARDSKKPSSPKPAVSSTPPRSETPSGRPKPAALLRAQMRTQRRRSDNPDGSPASSKREPEKQERYRFRRREQESQVEVRATTQEEPTERVFEGALPPSSRFPEANADETTERDLDRVAASAPESAPSSRERDRVEEAEPTARGFDSVTPDTERDEAKGEPSGAETEDVRSLSPSSPHTLSAPEISLPPDSIAPPSETKPSIQNESLPAESQERPMDSMPSEVFVTSSVPTHASLPSELPEGELPEGETVVPRSSPSLAVTAASPPPPLAAPPPPLSAPPPSMRPTAIGGISLGEVPGLEDLPEESQAELIENADIHMLAVNEEVSGFGLALVLDGTVAVMPEIADVMAAPARRGELVFCTGHLADGVAMRVVALPGGAQVASWPSAAFDAAVRDCPWVGDELKNVGDRLQALSGVLMGPMGDQLDDQLRALVIGRCEVRRLLPHEVIAEAGKGVPGMTIVGAGRVEVVDTSGGGENVLEQLGPGEFLFALQVLTASPAPATARAGKSGALVLFAERKIAHELMVSVPPLLGIFAQ